MNTMTHALAEAGVPLPTKRRRIWNWLKDHPNHLASDIAHALGLSLSVVSANLCALEDCGRVQSRLREQQTMRRGQRPRVKEFAVRGTNYDDPPPRIPRPAPEQTTAQVRLVSASAPVTLPPVPPAAHPVDLNRLTLQQVRALYAELREIFG